MAVYVMSDLHGEYNKYQKMLELINFSKEDTLTEYQEISKKAGDYLVNGGKNGSSPVEVAQKIYSITESKKRRLHYLVGKSTEIVLLSKLLPNKIIRRITRKTMLK